MSDTITLSPEVLDAETLGAATEVITDPLSTMLQVRTKVLDISVRGAIT